MRILPAVTSEQIAVARQLLEEYAGWLGVDLSFQGFAAELADLPGAYAPPHGRLLLAVDDDGTAAGCVALRPLGDEVCEMKRLFVRPGFRRQGSGRFLTERIVQEARAIGNGKRVDLMREINNAQVRRDPVHHSFAQSYRVIHHSEVGHENHGGRGFYNRRLCPNNAAAD